jgi:6-phosphogluconolactonase
MAEISVYPDREHLVGAAAEAILELAASAIKQRGRFTLALAGGDTPRPVYERLAEGGQSGRIDWSRVEVFFGDERCVPPDDPRSNYAMARAALLDHVSIPAANVHRMRGEDEPATAAADYEAVLKARLDRFDLILLGMGEDGHTASLFPGTPAVTEAARWVVAQFAKSAGMWRITLSPVVINQARNVIFLVSGAAKADTLRQVLEGPFNPLVRPSQVVEPSEGTVRWLVDAAAASRLRSVA